MGVRLSIFFCNSGNGRRDFFYDDDDDNEFRVVSMFFRSISCSFIGLTRTLPHRTLPKRRVRPGQVGSPMRERQNFPMVDGGEMRPRAESVLNTAGVLAKRMRGMKDLKGYSGRDGGKLSRLGELGDLVENFMLPMAVPMY
jgi:hypothetical protein